VRALPKAASRVTVLRNCIDWWVNCKSVLLDRSKVGATPGPVLLRRAVTLRIDRPAAPHGSRPGPIHPGGKAAADRRPSVAGNASRVVRRGLPCCPAQATAVRESPTVPRSPTTRTPRNHVRPRRGAGTTGMARSAMMALWAPGLGGDLVSTDPTRRQPPPSPRACRCATTTNPINTKRVGAHRDRRAAAPRESQQPTCRTPGHCGRRDCHHHRDEPATGPAARRAD